MLRLVKSGKIPDMSKRATPAAFKKAVCKRVMAARIAAGLRHEDIAQALGMSLDSVKRWESRSLIPHDLILPFCQLTNTKPEVILADPKRERRPSLTLV